MVRDDVISLHRGILCHNCRAHKTGPASTIDLLTCAVGSTAHLMKHLLGPVSVQSICLDGCWAPEARSRSHAMDRKGAQVVFVFIYVCMFLEDFSRQSTYRTESGATWQDRG